MSRESEQINLRLPDGMREQVRAAAKANGRSMNAEFAARIEESFKQCGFEVWWDEFAEHRLRVMGVTGVFTHETVKAFAEAAWIGAKEER